jgi:1,3-beta-glucan synthase
MVRLVFIPLCQTRLVDFPPAQRFTCFDRIGWNRAFFKTYYEKRSFGHLLVNFNRIWVMYISLFWFYTAYNAPTRYRPKRGRPL